jgi:hypothetical protein
VTRMPCRGLRPPARMLVSASWTDGLDTGHRLLSERDYIRRELDMFFCVRQRNPLDSEIPIQVPASYAGSVGAATGGSMHHAPPRSKRRR